jgi:elongation factor P
MYETSDIRNGLKVEVDGNPWTITYFQFVKPGKGCAFTRTKMKNLINGSTLERTFKSGERLAPAEVEEFPMQYMYHDGEGYHFMNLENYDQVAIQEDGIGDAKYYLVEQMEVNVLFYKGAPVSIDLPNFVNLEITYCEPGVKGNTAQGGTKSATMSTGLSVQVPLFMEQNDWLKIDTRTGEYVERVKA